MKKSNDIILAILMAVGSFYIWLMIMTVSRGISVKVEFSEFLVITGFILANLCGYFIYFNKSKMKGLNIVINMPLIIIFFFNIINDFKYNYHILGTLLGIILFIYILVVEIGAFNIYKR